MKKILVCVQEYPPHSSGIGNVAYQIVERLKKKGYECDVIHPETINFNKKYIKIFAGVGLLLFWNKVRKHIIKNYDKYDLIWLHNPLFVRKLDCNNIFSTVHTTYQGRMNYIKRYNFIIRTYYHLMKFFEKISHKKNKFRTNVISKTTASELKKLGIETVYIPNGVDTKTFNGKGSYDYPFDKNYFYGLCVGRIAYQKDPYKVVDFIDKVNEHIPMKLLWVGEGELYEDLKRYIKEKGIKHTHLIGKIPYHEISNIYGSVDFFLLGSVYEGQPLVLLEAMSSGLPCVVSKLENIKEIVEEANCGISIDFKDPKDLSRYLRSEKFKKDGERGKKYAQKHLDWDKIAERYIEWFEERYKKQKNS